MSLNNSDVLVAYARIRDTDTREPVFPKERNDEILACKSDKTRTEKHSVWKLLKKVVESHLMLKFDNLQFTKTANGKWICPDFHFSLSHTDGLVCVAVSGAPVGVDAQIVRPIRYGLKERVLTPDEISRFDNLPDGEKGEFLLTSWVKKESIFKRFGTEAFIPSRIEADGYYTVTRRISLGTDEYLVATSCEENNTIEFKFMEEI